jgi:hypothetical protein
MCMEHDIRLEHRCASPLAVVRHRASLEELSKVVPEGCGAVWRVIRAQQVAGAGRHVAIYWDGEINLEVGAEVAAPFPRCGEVVGSPLLLVSLPRRAITGFTANSARRMRRFDGGAGKTDIRWRVLIGRCMVTGKMNGTAIRRGSPPTSSTCSLATEVRPPNQALHPIGVAFRLSATPNP